MRRIYESLFSSLQLHISSHFALKPGFRLWFEIMSALLKNPSTWMSGLTTLVWLCVQTENRAVMESWIKDRQEKQSPKSRIKMIWLSLQLVLPKPCKINKVNIYYIFIWRQKPNALTWYVISLQVTTNAKNKTLWTFSFHLHDNKS